MAMQLRQNLNLRLEQRLKLTPQMIQSIEILLLPQMALEERIMHEVESNPTLEIVDEAPSESAEVMADREDDRWQLTERKPRTTNEDGPDKMAALAAAPERAPTLADHLVEQLRFVEMDDRVREFAHRICWALDTRGYLTTPLVELFEEDELEAAEEGLEHVRACDPAGLGARDLADCLLLQLKREQGDNSFEERLIRDHLDDLLRNRLPVIAQAMGVEVERVQEGLEVIGQLDPKPGLPFAAGENTIVIPDVTVERDEQTNEWIVSVPDNRLPKVRVSEAYHQLLEGSGADPREKAYLKEKLGAARFIIDAVAQRKRTLLKIVSEIIKHQQAFLEQGVEHLRPLMRQDIADKIGMHVATVSRAVKDKYIQTPAGVIPLADFFSGGIATQDGSEAESSKSVKLRIEKLITSEDKRDPYSDQEIADRLAKEGLDISRRTVTKYRIAEGIPSTRQRRVF